VLNLNSTVNADIAGGCTEAFRIIEMDPESDRRWEAFVAAQPRGLIYHHPAWIRTLEREYERESIVLALVDSAGQIRGVLPLMETRGLPFSVGRQMIGHRLSSLPRTPVAGPLAVDEQATNTLVAAAMDMVRRKPGTHLQLKLDSDAAVRSVEGLTGAPWRLTYELHLPEDPDRLRFGNARNHARIKWAVNKAFRHGVEVRPAETENELRAWYRLYLDTMRWHGVPARPYRFFQASWDLLRPRGLMRLLLAERQEGSRRVIIAGSIFLMFGSTIFYAFNGRRQEDLALRPNDAIQWQSIKDACEEGFSYYDFGEVVEDNQGLAEFKSKWGTEAKQLYRYYYPSPRQLPASHEGTPGPAQRLAHALWRRLPLQATAVLGDQIYGYL
jgi:CelD/BcsL family acetyltransferase involved in cellulose biosynthesis